MLPHLGKVLGHSFVIIKVETLEKKIVEYLLDARCSSNDPLSLTTVCGYRSNKS